MKGSTEEEPRSPVPHREPHIFLMIQLSVIKDRRKALCAGFPLSIVGYPLLPYSPEDSFIEGILKDPAHGFQVFSTCLPWKDEGNAY
jgi:hypothetical protein